MARFDCCVSPDPEILWLDVQSDFLSNLASRIVVPLKPKGSYPADRRLNPSLLIGDREYIMVTEQMGAVPARLLGVVVASIEAQGQKISNAIDFALFGL